MKNDGMKKLIVILVCSFSLIRLYGQDPNVDHPDLYPNNSIYTEFFGNSLFIASLNYERAFFHKDFLYVTGRIGIGYGYFLGLENLSAPINVNFIFRLYKALALEAAFGTTFMKTGQENDEGGWEYENVIVLNFIGGIRLQSKRGFLFRADFTPYYPVYNDVFNNSKYITPYFGLSVGRSFGKFKK